MKGGADARDIPSICPLAANRQAWYNMYHLNGEKAQMPITLTAPPTVVEGARSYAEHSGMTLEAFVLAYLESVAKRERERRERPRPAFLDVRYRLSEEGAAELMAAQADFGKIDEDMWK